MHTQFTISLKTASFNLLLQYVPLVQNTTSCHVIKTFCFLSWLAAITWGVACSDPDLFPQLLKKTEKQLTSICDVSFGIKATTTKFAILLAGLSTYTNTHSKDISKIYIKGSRTAQRAYYSTMQQFSIDVARACAVQVGKYSPIQRAATVLYRGTQFFAVSFAASMVGHSLTKYMVRHTHLMQPLCLTHQLPCQPTLAHVLAYSHILNDAFWHSCVQLCSPYGC